MATTEQPAPLDSPLVNASLILEGGGQRGVFTSGVLRAMTDEHLWLKNVYGVSMGACNGANYVSRQVDRNRRVNIGFINDRRYLSLLRWCLGGELFGMDFIFNEVPNSIDLFDYESYAASPQSLCVGLTDCVSGEAVHLDQAGQDGHVMDVFRATCALPLIARPVRMCGRVFMDGGIADPIPIRKSLEDGHDRHVVVLTQPPGYCKKPSRAGTFARLRHPLLRGLHARLADRHQRYNESMALVETLRREGRALVIRPGADLKVGRICRNRPLLDELFAQGLAAGQAHMTELKGFLAG